MAEAGRDNSGDAHIGDIRGALGTISQHDVAPRRGWRQRLLTLAAIVGPGLIVTVGDNDAGGVSTYSQAGQNYGTSLLWTLILLIPILIVNQEMVVRLGAVTGVGQARLIIERFGRFWGWFSVGDLFVLDFLTIVTEFIGVALALGYFGVSKYVAVPLAAAGLVAITASGSFRRWERFMLLFVAANFLIIPLAVFSHPHAGSVLRDLVVPGVRGGANSTSVLLIIAVIGTTVTPWQLFFQQSNIVDKRITPRWINYERVDTVVGSIVTILGAGALMVICAFAFTHTPLAGHYRDAAGVAAGLSRFLGHGAGTLYAVVLLNASIIGAGAVTLATSYAFGDVFGAHHSLDRRFRDATGFYASFAALVGVAAGIVLIPHAPLGLITTLVQALTGLLVTNATVFVLLLCNDRDVLGPWVNRAWLNAVALVIVAALLVLSFVLVVTTLFPHIDVVRLTVVTGAVTAGALLVMTVASQNRSRTAVRLVGEERRRRETWRMPPLALLGRPEWSRGRKIAMSSLRIYLVLAVVLLVVKAVQLGTGG
jgi:Mn2+/Fe2+ NRAMP family transporter